MKEALHPLTRKLLAELAAALRKFGNYSFDDKGPAEVMDIAPLVNDLRGLPAAEAAQVLRELALSRASGRDRPRSLATHLVGEMEHWEDLFAQPGINNIYDGESPNAAAETSRQPPRQLKALTMQEVLNQMLNGTEGEAPASGAPSKPRGAR